MSKRTTFIVLLTILFVGAIFRFYDLSRADVLTDEASIGFRAVGYLDFLATPYQTTPVEWMDERPWWSYLSFHDHPPLNFIIQNLTFKLFGVSTFVMRLPAAIFGLLSVFLVFLIGRRVLGESVGLVSASLLAANDYHIWISRTALQESAAIFFVLLGFWVLTKAVDNRKFLYLFGIIFGFALLIKIHTIIIFPLAVLYLCFFDRQAIKQKSFYFSGIFSLAIFSPYIIYNLFLYKNFGHFDFQFSYLFGQEVAEWSVRPGRFEFPTFYEKIRYFFINLKDTLSPIMFWGTGLSLIGAVTMFWKTRAVKFFFSTVILYSIFLILIIGPSRRFLVILVPWLAVMLALILLEGLKRYKKSFILLTVIILLFEGVFSFNTLFVERGIFSSGALRQLSQPYGYNELDIEVDKILENKKSAVVLPIANKNLSDFVEKSLAKQQGEEQAMMFIYDPRFYGEPILWGLTRRMIYEGWPVLSYEVYKQTVEGLGQNFFQELGIKEFYYIAPTKHALLQIDPSTSVSVEELNNFENSIKSLETREVLDGFGKPVFVIYKF